MFLLFWAHWNGSCVVGVELIGFVHTLCVVSLSVYGIQAILLTLLYLRHRGEEPVACQPDEQNWPLVAVQLPVYNEQHVIERLIDAAAALDYPANRLEIQVLDDSTDQTTQLAEARASYHRARGVNVRVLRRPSREGFKAGALAWGLQQTEAEFFAVFDADFSPHPDFLRRTIPQLLALPHVGVVQTRWSHLNEAYSPLTRLQALALDGHFVVEQAGRCRSNLLINFNGSGGVWRRACVEEAGGWQWDTMTEDMDLSYRAQISGWRSQYLPDVDAPAELPPQMEAFKRQQARWAQGSTQCLRKLGPRILGSDLTGRQKAMALVHIGSYLTQPIMILLLLTTLPVLWLSQPASSVLGSLWVVSLGPPLLYLVAESRLHRDWSKRLLYFPLLAAVFAGISWSTSRAVWQGLIHWGGTFRRTPKFRLEGHGGHWADSSYRLLPDGVVLGELLLMLYALFTVWTAWTRHQYGAIPFLLLFVLGFGIVAGSSICQAFRRLRAPIARH
jgi:cellulose synthase/poly-beta-1,6-N-acetylglucosamine synthase-like glycosyltransferase